MQCPGGVKNHLSDGYSPMGPRNVSPPGHQSHVIKSNPLVAPMKSRLPDIKIGAADARKSFLAGDAGTLEHDRGRV